MGPKYNRVQCNGNCTTAQPPLPASKCNYHSPRALYFQACAEKVEEGGCARWRAAVAEGHRALAASLVAIIIIYRASSPTLSLVPTIILVRTTPRPSAETLPPSLPLRCASQIELISGIYRAADFPFVLSLTRPTEYTSDGISLSARHICAAYNAHTAYATRSAANKFSTNNKSTCSGGSECASRPERENSSAESWKRPAGEFANSSVRFERIDQ